MYYSLNGTLIFTDLYTAVIECGGVGYKCAVTQNTLKQLPERGSKAFLYTYLVVREDAMDLFGFATQEELSFFKQLTGVNGVGPKAALAILSEFSPDKLAFAIASGDAKALTRAAGVGSKLAGRVVLELKDRVLGGLSGDAAATTAGAAAAVADSTLSQAIQALVTLGYSQSEATAAVSGADASLGVDEIIKLALKKLF